METNPFVDQRKFKLFVILGLILTIILLSAYTESQESITIRDKAPAFTLTAADNRTISLSDYAGKPVLLYFHMALG